MCMYMCKHRHMCADTQRHLCTRRDIQAHTCAHTPSDSVLSRVWICPWKDCWFGGLRGAVGAPCPQVHCSCGHRTHMRPHKWALPWAYNAALHCMQAHTCPQPCSCLLHGIFTHSNKFFCLFFLLLTSKCRCRECPRDQGNTLHSCRAGVDERFQGVPDCASDSPGVGVASPEELGLEEARCLV